jgi:dethiobiotin synthetase
MKGLFITGTDTGVGKTFVAAAVLKAWRAHGVDAVPIKPVQTGCTRKRGGSWVAEDLEFCLAAGGLNPLPSERRLMVSYAFRPACSPHLAAAEAGARISIPRIVAACRRLARAHDAVVVEGAGGVLAPLGQRRTMLDLMRALGLPVILVARPGLGTLNHTFLSLRVLRGAGLDVAGVVLNQVAPGRRGLIETDNRRTIERMGRVSVLADLRYGIRLANAAGAVAKVLEAGVRSPPAGQRRG